ncbi:hypothetical protein LTR53_003723 [Teratosphaeriaceae sp. CCFEE 6253]|nr:hypothetical protein LTR53_003723 [Teratosphaeriaceae sp. CCFEE 6253]
MDSTKAEIKPEIKIDGADGERRLGDIAEYEDDIDTSFPDPNAQAWLVKVPEDLWKSWAEIYKDAPDDTPIEVGKMRLYHQPQGETDTKKQKIQIRLHNNVPQFQSISKQYNLAITTIDYSNVVVFSEKDLPGHKPGPIGRNRAAYGSKPTGIPSRDQRYGANKPGRSRSAIPKQTSLAPRIQHEASATPIIDAAYEAAFASKWAAHVTPREPTAFITGIDRSTLPGMTSKYSNFNTFGRSAKPKRGGGKSSKDKNVRMERGLLVDVLQRCFRRYSYWPLKALRNELRQPEAWIKEVLEDIAVLVRSGDFAMNYTLREDMKYIIQQDDVIKDEMAKVESAEDDATGAETADDLDDDDDLEGFEDVRMEGGGI